MIIGISGLANSGKDTVANYLTYNHNFVKIAFADKIKRILYDVYDLSYDKLWGPSNNRSMQDLRFKIPDSKEYLSARVGSQAFGDCGRSLYLDTWCDYTVKQIKLLNTSYFYDYEDYKGVYKNYFNPGKKNVVVSDCRYLNEMNKIRDIGGKIIRIKKKSSGLKDKCAKHSSESNQIEILDSYFDEVLVNDGTLPELYQKIDLFMSKQT